MKTLIATPGSIHIVLLVALLVASAYFFASNQKYRGAIDDALSSKPGLLVPERQKTYDAEYLTTFKNVAASKTTRIGPVALDLYIHPTLLWIDVGFAITLSAFMGLFWLVLPGWLPTFRYSVELCTFFAAMGILYGIADVCEDLWLAKVLGSPEPISSLDGALACKLTQLKLFGIVTSIVGGILFVIFSYIFRQMR